MLLVPAVLINAIGYGEYTHIAFYVMLVTTLAVLLFTTDPPAKPVFLQLVSEVAVSMLSSVLNMARHLTGGASLHNGCIGYPAVFAPGQPIRRLRSWRFFTCKPGCRATHFFLGMG